MKRQIRRGVFETNSSSVHSLTMMSREDYNKWRDDGLYLSGDDVLTVEDIKKEYEEKIKSNPKYKDWYPTLEDYINENDFKTYDMYWEDTDYETFEDSYRTKSGEEIIAFGYYGHD